MVMAESHALTLGVCWEKCYNAAHRRALKAVEALARIRRLARPSVQVNIAQRQQVNTAEVQQVIAGAGHSAEAV